ncbi:hypothetical protein H4R33_006901 [Dimargaris cristalligena]|nr:hypothetical protein H4R33_006901 [Dimargaris cristalligena]
MAEVSDLDLLQFESESAPEGIIQVEDVQSSPSTDIRRLKDIQIRMTALMEKTVSLICDSEKYLLETSRATQARLSLLRSRDQALHSKWEGTKAGILHLKRQTEKHLVDESEETGPEKAGIIHGQ